MCVAAVYHNIFISKLNQKLVFIQSITHTMHILFVNRYIWMLSYKSLFILIQITLHLTHYYTKLSILFVKPLSIVIYHDIIQWNFFSRLHWKSFDILIKWRPLRKSGLTHKTTKAMVIRYAIIQSPQWFSELTHSSSEVSIYCTLFREVFIDDCTNYLAIWIKTNI